MEDLQKDIQNVRQEENRDRRAEEKKREDVLKGKKKIKKVRELRVSQSLREKETKSEGKKNKKA